MIIATIVIALYFFFLAFCNGIITAQVIYLTENGKIPFWKAWQQFSLKEGWTGWNGVIAKSFYFIPQIAAWILRAVNAFKT